MLGAFPAWPVPGLRGMGIERVFEQALPRAGWSPVGTAATWVLFADTRQWLPWLAAARSLLDAQESDRVGRRRNPAEGEALSLAYALHRLLLARLSGLAPRAVPLWRDERGCPRVGEGPLATSLSHTGSWVALAASTAGPVGVDVESLARLEVLPEIADSICHPAEHQTLAGLDEQARAMALMRLWVRKEALLKAAGMGLEREMNGFSVLADEVRLNPGEGRLMCLDMLAVGPHCLGAVARPPELGLRFAHLLP